MASLWKRRAMEANEEFQLSNPDSGMEIATKDDKSMTNVDDGCSNAISLTADQTIWVTSDAIPLIMTSTCETNEDGRSSPDLDPQSQASKIYVTDGTSEAGERDILIYLEEQGKPVDDKIEIGCLELQSSKQEIKPLMEPISPPAERFRSSSREGGESPHADGHGSMSEASHKVDHEEGSSNPASPKSAEKEATPTTETEGKGWGGERMEGCDDKHENSGGTAWVDVVIDKDEKGWGNLERAKWQYNSAKEDKPCDERMDRNVASSYTSSGPLPGLVQGHGERTYLNGDHCNEGESDSLGKEHSQIEHTMISQKGGSGWEDLLPREEIEETEWDDLDIVIKKRTFDATEDEDPHKKLRRTSHGAWGFTSNDRDPPSGRSQGYGRDSSLKDRREEEVWTSLGGELTSSAGEVIVADWSKLASDVPKVDKETEAWAHLETLPPHGRDRPDNFNVGRQEGATPWPQGRPRIERPKVEPECREIDDIVQSMKSILFDLRNKDGARLSEEHEAAVRAVLQYHPRCTEKMGCGVDYIKIDRPSKFSGVRCFWVVRSDATETDFSYHKCLKEKVAKEFPEFIDRYDAIYCRGRAARGE